MSARNFSDPNTFQTMPYYNTNGFGNVLETPGLNGAPLDLSAGGDFMSLQFDNQNQFGLQNPNLSRVPLPAVDNSFTGLNLTGGPGGANAGMTWSDRLFGSKGNAGVLFPALQSLASFGNLYLGSKALKQSKKQFKEDVRRDRRDFATSAQIYNNQLGDQARARYAANPNAYRKPEEVIAEKRIG